MADDDAQLTPFGLHPDDPKIIAGIAMMAQTLIKGGITNVDIAFDCMEKVSPGSKEDCILRDQFPIIFEYMKQKITETRTPRASAE